MKILAIETTCDETGIAVLETPRRGSGQVFRVLSNVVSSQVKIHAKWGGVVPNLAKREHQANLIPVLKKALRKSNLLKQELRIKNQGTRCHNSLFVLLSSILEREPELLKKIIPFLKKYKKPKIDAIVVVNGPGLEPALWVGINFAKALNVAWGIPIMPINHLEGHIFSVFLPEKNQKSKIKNLYLSRWLNEPIRQNYNSKFKMPNVKFPAVTLLVSGGHTQLVLIKNWLKYKIIGQTRDDAAGEAFDKLAKMLNLGYPGGPAIAACASELRIKNQESRIKLPRPMINSKDYDFSFSGLKTAALYKIRELEAENKKPLSDEIKSAICFEFQNAVVETLVSKTLRAAKEYKAKTIILGGGVAANKLLKDGLAEGIKKQNLDSVFYFPDSKYSGDNAGMAALAAYFRYFKKLGHRKTKFIGFKHEDISAEGNLELK
jgi:N6-L-threonylcarbamoyladenine synthase